MHGSLRRLVVMSGLGGASNAAILAAVNSGAEAAGAGNVSLPAAAIFVVALLIFIKTQHYILIATTVEIEAIIHKVRVRLMDQVRHSELLPLDAIGRAAVVAAITKESGVLTQATNMIAFSGQAFTHNPHDPHVPFFRHHLPNRRSLPRFDDVVSYSKLVSASHRGRLPA